MLMSGGVGSKVLLEWRNKIVQEERNRRQQVRVTLSGHRYKEVQAQLGDVAGWVPEH